MPRVHVRLLFALSLAAACAACSAGAPASAPSATAPDAQPPVPPPVASAPPPTASSPAPTAAAATASAAASAAPVASSAADTPLPKVRVENIGMHIGGGPNDAPTKDPIRRSVAPHFDTFKRCFGKVDDQKKPGDFGVDLLIPKDGGKPQKVSRVRTTLEGAGFRDCVVSTFEQIDFEKPRGGLTMVSYSLRFTP